MNRYLPIVLRAFTERLKQPKPGIKVRKRPDPKWPRTVLVFDTETTIDPTQRLLFGSYRFCRWEKDCTLRCVEEGIFYANELPERDPHGFACLQKYAVEHKADVAPGCATALTFMSQEKFARKFFWAAYDTRALIVGFNLPFDLSRIGVDWRPARKRYEGGFSLPLGQYSDRKTGAVREDLYVSRVRFKKIDSKRSLIGLSQPRPDRSSRREPFEGYFVDARTLAFSLTNEGLSLDSACKKFRVENGKRAAKEHGRITPEYIDYNRNDVGATKQLLEKLRAEFDLHPVELAPYKSLSPASVAKAYWRAMNVNPPDKQFSVSREFYGQTMTAYYGGRSECRIRRVIVPVVYCDFLSMYPTVNTLMGLWWLITAQNLRVVDATREVQRFLDALTVDDCFNKQTWRDLLFFAEIVPDGDVVPVRASYGTDDSFTIGVNPLRTEFPLWYGGPDLVASKVLTGKTPKILRAFRLAPEGQQNGLRPVKLRGAIEVDPRAQDFFRVVIEQRKRLADEDPLSIFLKVLANAGSYGIFAQMDRHELPPKQRECVRVFGLHDSFTTESRAPEEPGPFCFPPIAALITAAARLMLALLERCVTDAGGSYAFCDTDSMAIVSTQSESLVACPNGPIDGHIEALSWSQVVEIVRRFESLNPYDRATIPGSVLKIEKQNRDQITNELQQLYCFAISAKRYSLFNR